MKNKKDQLALLFREIKQGNTHAFDELFLRYHDPLLGFALQHTKQQEAAEEITSELFVKIWIKRTELDHVLNPEVYLFVSIKNASLNWIRNNARRSKIFAISSEEIPDKISSYGTDPIEEKELMRLLDLTVATLPQQRQIIFKLIKEQGLKRHEVAEILGISIRTVENQLHKALIILADAISGYLGYNPRRKSTRKNTLSLLNFLFF
jgi:RNA polymerase sigma-70 factor (family 1)